MLLIIILVALISTFAWYDFFGEFQVQIGQVLVVFVEIAGIARRLFEWLGVARDGIVWYEIRTYEMLIILYLINHFWFHVWSLY